MTRKCVCGHNMTTHDREFWSEWYGDCLGSVPSKQTPSGQKFCNCTGFIEVVKA